MEIAGTAEVAEAAAGVRRQGQLQVGHQDQELPVLLVYPTETAW